MTVKQLSDNTLVVELKGEPHVRPQLNEVMELFSTKKDCDILIDFSNVDILRSMSLAGFLKLHKLVETFNRRLIFCRVSPMTKQIFKVTCFDGIFEFADDRNEAKELLHHQLA
jgi:anti-anti-sigma factor